MHIKYLININLSFFSGLFNVDGRKFTQKEITVYIGFCDQSPSEGSGSLNPKEVAKSSGF